MCITEEMFYIFFKFKLQIHLSVNFGILFGYCPFGPGIILIGHVFTLTIFEGLKNYFNLYLHVAIIIFIHIFTITTSFILQHLIMKQKNEVIIK